MYAVLFDMDGTLLDSEPLSDIFLIKFCREIGFELTENILDKFSEVEMWEVLNGIFYVLVEGVRWRSLPGDFPVWQTVYTYFRNWRKNGTWLKIHDSLRQWTRIEQERHRSPSEGIIDSQSVKSAAMVISPYTASVSAIL